MRNGCWVSMVVAVAAAAFMVSGCGSSNMPLATQGNGGAGGSGSGGVGGSAAGRGGSGGSAGTGGSATAGTGGSATAGTGGSATAGTGGSATAGTGGTTAGTNGGGGVGGTTAGGGGRGGGGGGGGGDSGTGGTGGGGAGSNGNHALRFDGASDQVVFPTGGADEHAFTVELWFRSAAMTGMLVEVFSTTGGADRSLYLKNGAVCFYVFTPAYSELCTTSTTLNDGAWHHAAGVLGTNGQHLYVDGASEGSAAGVTSSAFTTDTNLRAGFGYIGPNGPMIYLAGDLDEIRLWNAERTAGEIAAARATEINPATSGLQGYWKLDDGGTSTTARDATAHGYDGALMGFTFTPSPWVTPGAF